MFNDKLVYTEHAVLKEQLKKNCKQIQELSSLHNIIIDLCCDNVCQVDCKFGLDLIKIKKESWKTQVAGIADSYLYERYSRNLFKHQNLIDYSFSEIKNINGQDLYQLVFVNNKKVNNNLFRILINLSKDYVVIPIECVDFKLCEHDGHYDIIDNVFVYRKNIKEKVINNE